MAVVIGHSQTKYLSEYLSKDSFSVFSYPGYSVHQFVEEDILFEVVPFFSVVVIVVGANDVGKKTPSEIATEIEHLCQIIHLHSPSAKLLVSEILPRAQNEFPDCQHNWKFLQNWNRDAYSVNRQLHEIARLVKYINIIHNPEFYSFFGARRSMLSRDGLHLSHDGTQEMVSMIESTTRCVMSTHVTNKVKRPTSLPHKPKSLSPCVHDLPSAPLTSKLPLNRKVWKGAVKQHKTHTSSMNASKISKPKPTSHKKPMQCAKKKNNNYLTTSKDIILIETHEKYMLSCDAFRHSPLEGGGKDVPIFSTTERKLMHYEAADILIQNLPESITNEPPYRPSAGGVYLYDDSGKIDTKEDWRADGYTWRNLGKRKYITNDGKKMERLFFKIRNQGVTSDDFERQVFRFIEDDYNGRTLIVYYGNHEAYIVHPHGNRKKNSRPYKRTKPSVITDMKNRCKDIKPMQLCEKMRSEKSPETTIRGVSVPKNSRQIKNLQAKQRKENMLSHDALYALHLLVDQLDDYILSIKTTPDLEVVLGNKELFDEVNKLLQLNEIIVNLFYDSTFNLGDFYVSTIAIQHPMFKETPVIPIAFMLHERKFQTCHEHFIELIKSKIPKLTQKNVNVVTDREKGIINAFKEKLGNSQIIICWNHILNDIKFWVKKHGGGADDIKVYETNVRALLQSENKEDFDNKYDVMKLKWSEAFLNYFDENIHETVVEYASRWLLEEKGIYNPYSGITNNVSESLNAQLKRLIDRKEKRIDEIVLFFYYLQGNALSNLIAAFCGESEWTLNHCFKFATLDPDTVILPKNVCHPDKLIDLIRGELVTLVKDKQYDNNSRQSNHDDIHLNITNDNQKGQIKTSSGPNTQKTLASKIIIDNDIVLVPQMGAFMVKGSKDKNHSVTLFPKESCTCPSSSRCYHIIAAMMSIGMSLPEDKKMYNLTQLRKNCRPKHQKKCGTKKGRKGDNEFDNTINPAPDSVAKIANASGILNTPINSEHKRTKQLKDSNVKKTLFQAITPNSSKPLITSTPKTPRSILKNKSQGSDTCNKRRKLQFHDENFSKLQQIEDEISMLSDNDDLVELESYREETSNNLEKQTINVKWWIKDLQLTIEDQFELLNGGKLNSNHMEAVNKLLRKQVGNKINGLQLTEKVPVFNDTEKRWAAKFPFDPVEKSPACQIHHTHNDHWVVTFYHNNTVYLLDSLGNERNINSIIPDGLKVQLSQIYGRNIKCLTINLPAVIKQTNSVDCGLFAIAFATSYCLRRSLCYDLIFDTKALRNHLFNCFDNKKITEFPLTNKTLGIRRRKYLRVTTIEQYCICNMPECLADMVQCDNCLCWYHKFCINAPSDVSSLEEDYNCGLC